VELQTLSDSAVLLDGTVGIAKLTNEHRTLIAQWEADGRRPFAKVAPSIGRSEAHVARRVEALRASGLLLIVTGVAMAPFGLETTAMIWITVAPAHISSLGTELATHTEVTFAGAVSGPVNLVVAVACHNPGDLYRYITERLGAIAAIERIDVVVDHVIKRHGTVMKSERLYLSLN
jgi:DNA-binding Lrp family transcriptional regulator